jgi:hypothetical protein
MRNWTERRWRGSEQGRTKKNKKTPRKPSRRKTHMREATRRGHGQLKSQTREKNHREPSQAKQK